MLFTHKKGFINVLSILSYKSLPIKNYQMDHSHSLFVNFLPMAMKVHESSHDCGRRLASLAVKRLHGYGDTTKKWLILVRFFLNSF
jgi:hypothetical protein